MDIARETLTTAVVIATRLSTIDDNGACNVSPCVHDCPHELPRFSPHVSTGNACPALARKARFDVAEKNSLKRFFEIQPARSPLLSFSRLTNSFDPEWLRLTLKADSDPGFVISDLDLP